jgi:hypothetical protein
MVYQSNHPGESLSKSPEFNKSTWRKPLQKKSYTKFLPIDRPKKQKKTMKVLLSERNQLS